MLTAWKVIKSKKWFPNYHSHPSRGQSPPLNEKKRLYSKRIEVVIIEPHYDLITSQAANIWGKPFLSRRLFILDSAVLMWFQEALKLGAHDDERCHSRASSRFSRMDISQSWRVQSCWNLALPKLVKVGKCYLVK